MDLGKIVKKSVEKQKMLAWQFNTIGVSDAVTMGHDGMVIASPRPSQKKRGPLSCLTLCSQECAIPSSPARS